MPATETPGARNSVSPETLALARVTSIPPYPPGRPITAVAREFGLDPQNIIKLASNENPLGPSPAARAAIIASATSGALYPDFDTFALRTALSRHLDVSPEWILPGEGSSDHIVLVARAFLEAGKSALVSQYSFAAYQGAVASVGARTGVVPARNFAVDLEAMLAAIDPTVAVIYLATINNPTGTRLDAAALEDFIARVPPHVVVVLDEAYREYLEPADRVRSDRWPEARPNIVILRTFSKIHGLAGLRVGYAIADPRMVGVLRRLQLPFSVSAVAEAAAVAALGDERFPETARMLNATERARVQAVLADRRIEFIPSHGNFILLRVGHGRAVFQALQRRGVIVRPVDNYQLPEWIRVSVGLPHENDRFLQTLLEALP